LSQLEEKEQKQRDIVNKLERNISELEASRLQLTEELNQYKANSQEKDKVISDLQNTVISQNKQMELLRIEEAKSEGAQQINDLLEKVHILENINESLETSVRDAQRVFEGNKLTQLLVTFLEQTEHFRRRVQSLTAEFARNHADGELLEQQRNDITELEIQVSELEVALKLTEGEKSSLSKQLEAVRSLKQGSSPDHYQEIIQVTTAKLVTLKSKNFQKENSTLLSERHQLMRELRYNFCVNN
jgi:chromosome segregation ATPase